MTTEPLSPEDRDTLEAIAGTPVGALARAILALESESARHRGWLEILDDRVLGEIDPRFPERTERRLAALEEAAETGALSSAGPGAGLPNVGFPDHDPTDDIARVSAELKERFGIAPTGATAAPWEPEPKWRCQSCRKPLERDPTGTAGLCYNCRGDVPVGAEDEGSHAGGSGKTSPMEVPDISETTTVQAASLPHSGAEAECPTPSSGSVAPSEPAVGGVAVGGETEWGEPVDQPDERLRRAIADRLGMWPAIALTASPEYFADLVWKRCQEAEALGRMVGEERASAAPSEPSDPEGIMLRTPASPEPEWNDADAPPDVPAPAPSDAGTQERERVARVLSNRGLNLNGATWTMEVTKAEAEELVRLLRAPQQKPEGMSREDADALDV